jgi:hypothetical protein
MSPAAANSSHASAFVRLRFTQSRSVDKESLPRIRVPAQWMP